MNIKLTYEGVTFEVTSPQEAADLFRLLRKESVVVREPKGIPSGGDPAGRTENEKKELTLRVLILIKEAGERGADSAFLASKLSLDTRRLAHVSNILRAFCKRHKIDIDDVFNRKQPANSRIRTWYAGKDIDKAISAAKKDIKNETVDF